MPSDVFEENPLWATFPDDTGDVGPEVARIVGTSAFARCAEGLAGISREDDIEGTAEDPGIEAAEIVPDWCWGEIPSALGGDENGTRPVVPLDEGAGVIAGLGEHEAQIQASAACAEGQSMPGT